MTIEFVCKQVAEIFDTPCNFSPMDEEMLDLDGSWCEKHCGDIEPWQCWQRYFWLKWKEGKARDK